MDNYDVIPTDLKELYHEQFKKFEIKGIQQYCDENSIDTMVKTLVGDLEKEIKTMDEKETLIPYHQRVNIALEKANSYIQRYYLSKKEVSAEDTAEVEIMRSMRRAIDALMKEIEKLRGQGWIPVSERLPTMEEYRKDDGRFIVTDGNRSYMDLFDIYDQCWLGGGNDFAVAWQPLPDRYTAPVV